MPIKLKPSVKKVDRNTKKVTIEHSYIKQTPKAELFELLNKSVTAKKEIGRAHVRTPVTA